MLSRTQSLRWQIQLWHALILALVISAFITVFYVLESRQRESTINNELLAAVEVLRSQLSTVPPEVLKPLIDGAPAPRGIRRSVDKLMVDLRVPGTFAARDFRDALAAPYFAVFRFDGSIIKTSVPWGLTLPDFVAATGTPNWRDESRQQIAGQNRIDGPARPPSQTAAEPIIHDTGEIREVYVAGPPGTWVLVGREITTDRKDLQGLLILLIGIGSGVFALGLLGGWVLSRDSVRPIEEMAHVAAAISHSSLDQRIDTSDMQIELASLGDTLNNTFERLEAAFARQAQFTADASHELRTPLAVLKMHQQLALMKPRTAEEYQQALETCRRATERMENLVESLLTLARVDSSGVTLDRKTICVQELISHVLEQVEPYAQQREIEIALTEYVEAGFTADLLRLSQVLVNLLNNAIAYSPAGSLVEVSSHADSKSVEFRVRDYGPGIPVDDQQRIFERFYRVDKQRSRESGGSGLGLSICRDIVTAHGGTISVDSAPGSGSTFIVRIPVTTAV